MIDENNQEEPEVEEIPDLKEETQEGEEETDWKAEALKLKGIAQRYKTRLDKVKVVPDEPKLQAKPEPAKEPTVSIADLHALRNVHEDDIAEVQEYAKFKNLSIKEALNSSVVKTLLAEKEEMRKTAEAANTKITRRSPQKPSEEQALSDFESGKIPEDPAEAARLRFLQRKNSIKKN